MLTTRDLQIVDFLSEYKVANTSTITELFFPSRVACYKRLQILNMQRVIKRVRDSVTSEYIYYKKLPKQVKHSLLVSDFYRELHMKTEIINFKIEPIMGDIRPDAVFGYKHHGKTFAGLLEIEISHKGFNYAKYERFYNSDTYKNFLPVMPTVFVVGYNVKFPTDSKIKYKVIKTDFCNIGGVL
jgi:hypothetical protein